MPDIEPILRHKAGLIRGSRADAETLLQRLGIEDPVEACLVGAVDAMIFDVASTLGRRGWTARERRAQLIEDIWHE